MSARCSLVVNGKSVRVSTGDTPLEAALADGHDRLRPGAHGVLPRRHRAPPGARRPPAPARAHRPDPAGPPAGARDPRAGRGAGARRRHAQGHGHRDPRARPGTSIDRGRP